MRRLIAAGTALALVGCGLAGLVWPTIAWVRTGVPDAYTVTMSAWRGGDEVVPFLPTVERVQLVFGDTGGTVRIRARAPASCSTPCAIMWASRSTLPERL